MANQAVDTANAAAAAGTEVAATTAEQGRAVAGTAMDEAKHVVDAAKEQTARVADEVGTQARAALDQAKTDVRSQADAQTERLAEGLRSLAGQVQALLDGRTEEAGRLPDLARQATDQLQTLAGRIGDGGVDGLLRDTQRFARRRPGLFLAGAAAAGFLGGRLFRGAKAASESTAPPAPLPASAPMAAATTQGTDVIVLRDDQPDTVLSAMRQGAV